MHTWAFLDIAPHFVILCQCLGTTRMCVRLARQPDKLQVMQTPDRRVLVQPARANRPQAWYWGHSASRFDTHGCVTSQYSALWKRHRNTICCILYSDSDSQFVSMFSGIFIFLRKTGGMTGGMMSCTAHHFDGYHFSSFFIIFRNKT